MEGPMLALREGLARLYKNNEFADFAIMCGPYTFKVHKAVICAQSEYFTTACSSGKFGEGEEGRITLKAIGSEDGDDETCDDPEAVKHMVYYFYHLDYDAARIDSPGANVGDTPANGLAVLPHHGATASPSGKHRLGLGTRRTPSVPQQAVKPVLKTAGNMVMHARVFAAAVKYQVQALQVLAASKFTAAVEASWDHDDFAEAAHIVYTTTPEEARALRNEVAKCITEHGALLDKAAVEAVVRGISGLAAGNEPESLVAPNAHMPTMAI
ncbi:hypothetical protein B0A55_10383 [Friedmanniomyces simplex]|uniref:BTB domain-containing protein n=1 Tax=Friedmanniomyces simplex TaxID=329884 RepID=A0A4U0WNR7_9PEZI|nr:hypothetical protein B0A55_10383 [Friedmanniomyces simplex]